MAEEILDSKYNGDTGGDYVLEVSVMKASFPDKSYLDATYDYVRLMLDDVYNGGYVPATIARKISTDKTFDCDGNIRDQANTYLDNNNWGDGNYLWIIACDDTSWGVGAGGWTGRTVSTTFTRGKDEHAVACTGLMECLHPYLEPGNCSRADRIVDYSEDDHSYGHIDPGSYKRTPMLGWYGRDVCETGNCDNYRISDYGLGRDLTDCAKQGLEYCWKHRAGQH